MRLLALLLALSATRLDAREEARVRVAAVARPAGNWHSSGLARAVLARLAELDRVVPANFEAAQRLVPSDPDRNYSKLVMHDPVDDGRKVVEAGKRLRAQFVIRIQMTMGKEDDVTAEIVDVATGAFQGYLVTAPPHALPGILALDFARYMRLPLTLADQERLAKPLVADAAAVEPLWEGDAERKPEAQVRLYERALQHDPKSALIRNQLGAALARAGQADRALEEFDRAIALLPAYAAPHTNRGVVLKRQQKWAEAEAAFRRAIALGARSPTPFVELARLRDRLGGPREAVEHLETAVAIDPSHLDALLTLGVYYFEQTNFAAARRNFERVLEIDPENLEALYHIGLLHLAPQDYEKAAATFRKALAAHPGSAVSVAGLGLALYGQKKVQEAVETVRRAIALDPRSATAHFYLGQIYLTEKRYDEAAEALQRAVELNPDLTAAQQSLAVALRARRAPRSGCGCLRGTGLEGGPAGAAAGALLPVALLLAPHAFRLGRRRRTSPQRPPRRRRRAGGRGPQSAHPP